MATTETDYTDPVPEALWPVIAQLGEAAPLAVMLLDSSGHILRENRAARKLLGLPVTGPSPNRGVRIDALPNVRDSGAGPILRGLLGGSEVRDVMLDLVSTSGHPVSLLLDGGAVRDGAGNITGVWLAGRDLGSDANQSGRMLALQRMEILGLSVTGVIHDLNNTLTGLSGALELMKGGQEPGHQLLSALDGMVRRSQDIASRLLEVSRPGPQGYEAMDLRTPVRQATDLMRHGLGPGITIHANLPRGQVPVECARTNLLQCFFNLGTNARDAMGGKGTISLELEVVDDEARCEAEGWPGSRYARLTFRDTGPGVPQETAERIWEPFFTTKPGSGTGMGLSVVHRAVLDHGGRVRLIQEAGAGACFEISLPMYLGLVDDDEPTRTMLVPRTLHADGPPLQGRRVLVADDEAALRLVLDTGLSHRGAEVVPVGDGMEALAAAHRATDDGQPFHAAIVDMHMPGLDGLSLVAELRSREPLMRLIVTSGPSPTRTA